MQDVAGILRSVNRSLEFASKQGMRKLRVELVDHNQPYTDMTTGVIYVPKLKPTSTPLEVMVWLGYIWHEAGHHHPIQSALVAEMKAQGISFGSPLGNAINALDDYWQEKVSSRLYIGAAQALDNTQGYHCGKGLVSVTEARNRGEQVDDMCIELLGLCYKARCSWQNRVLLEYKDWDKLRSNHNWDKYIPRMDAWLDNTSPKSVASDLIALARELLEEQTGEDSHDESQQGKGDSEQGSSGDQAGDGADGRGEPSEGKGQATGGTISYKDLMGHDHSLDENNTICSVEGHILYDHTPAYDYEPWLKVDEYIPEGISHSKADSIRRVYDQSAPVSARVLRLFQAASQNARLHQQRRGRLTTKHLARVQRGDDRVFHKEISKMDKESEVYVLVDGSGSMGWGDKYEKATSSGIHLCEVLSKVNIPNKLAVFSDRGSECRHVVVKDWHERPSSERMIQRASKGIGGCNADGDSVLHAYNDLRTRKGKRKILIVLSDGEPASSRGGDCYTFVQEVVKSISKTVECYGIGIGDDSVKYIYPEYSVLKSASDIETCLTDVVKSKILR